MRKKIKFTDNLWASFNTSGKHHSGMCFSFTKYKALEINFYHKFNLSLSFNAYINRKCDHPGITIELIILGFGLGFEFYDGRHWDNKTKKLY